MPQLDFTYYTSQLFWLALTFFALFFLVLKVVVPNMEQGLQERRETLKSLDDSIASLEEVISDSRNSYDLAIANARDKANTAIREQLSIIEKEKEKKLRLTISKMEKMMLEHKTDVDRFIQSSGPELVNLSLSIFNAYISVLASSYPAVSNFTEAEIKKEIDAESARLIQNFYHYRNLGLNKNTSSTIGGSFFV